MSDKGYVDYFEVLGLTETCKPGEVRKHYKHLMKDLVIEIARAEITDESRNRFLLRMAQLNAAFYILRENTRRQEYIDARRAVIDLEEAWRKEEDDAEADQLRRRFDQALRNFLSTYMEELMLEAGRDKECVEASNWDLNHERHAGRVLREYRQQLYHQIHERLPFYDVSEPQIDWEERRQTTITLLEEMLHG